jgi:hypothetical protein
MIVYYENHSLSLWAFSIVQNSKNKIITFRKVDLFPSSDEERETHTLLGD